MLHGTIVLLLEETWLLSQKRKIKVLSTNLLILDETSNDHGETDYNIFLPYTMFIFSSAFLMSLLKNTATDAWIGLNDINHEHTYLWTDGSPVYYTNWAKGSRSYYSKVKNVLLPWNHRIIESQDRIAWVERDLKGT